jgi:hypothetical protein
VRDGFGSTHALARALQTGISTAPTVCQGASIGMIASAPLSFS